MGCVAVTEPMRDLLDALAAWPNVDIQLLRASREWADARTWGWLMELGELTGLGLAHAGVLPGGLVKEWLQ